MSALDWTIAYGAAALVWALLMMVAAGYGAAKQDKGCTEGAMISLFLSPVWPLVFAFMIGFMATDRGRK